jgi:DNA-binding HxlR family transcriptional regulator
MRTYGQFCPIAVGAEIFAQRWTPLILRELFSGSTRFNDLERGLPRIPRAMLAQRLRALEAYGVIERRHNELRGTSSYHLTPSGQDLAEVAIVLGDWAKRWGHAQIGAQNLDPDFLMWDIHREIVLDRIPLGRTVVRIDLIGACQRPYWLVLERPEPSLCLVDPGLDIDLFVTADTVAIHKVWVGELAMTRALKSGAIVLDGHPDLCRDFSAWLALGFFTRPRSSRLAIAE